MQQNQGSIAEDSNTILNIFLHAGFLLIGILTVILGQVLPFLSARLLLNDNQSGYLFIAQFLGSIFGVLTYSTGIRKFGYPKTLLVAFLLMSLGCLGLNFGFFSLCLAAVFIYGLGIGISIPTTNMLVVELNQPSPAPALNFLNVFWGIGAILSKPYVDIVGTRESIFLPTMFLSGVFFFTGFLIVISKLRTGKTIKPTEKTDISKRIWKNPLAWLIAIFNFLNIGIESSVGGWVTSFELRLSENPEFIWIPAASVFFLFMVLGRGAASYFVKVFGVDSLLVLNGIIMTFGILIIITAWDIKLLLFGTAVFGLGTSSVFPTNMARFTSIFGEGSTKKAAPVFIMGSLGGAFLTWLVGFISNYSSDLRTGLYAVLAACLALIALQFVISGKNLKKG